MLVKYLLNNVAEQVQGAFSPLAEKVGIARDVVNHGIEKFGRDLALEVGVAFAALSTGVVATVIAIKKAKAGKCQPALKFVTVGALSLASGAAVALSAAVEVLHSASNTYHSTDKRCSWSNSYGAVVKTECNILGNCYEARCV